MRIEASRQSAEVKEVFVTLAINLNRTVDEVRETLHQQFATLVDGEKIVRDLMQQVSSSIRQQRVEVTAALATARGHLRTLGDALGTSGAGAANLSQLNQGVACHVGGIVMAQQCQDITRQKIEHVGEAMDKMRIHLDETPPGAAPGDSDPRQFVFHAGQIQLQQVQGVFDDLHRAAAGLKSGIESLRNDAGAAAAVALKVGGTALDAKVASLCQSSIAGILRIVQEAVQQIAAIVTAFAPLQATFVNCTSKATELADDVRHAALNAQVFAIQAPDGATLEVLASRVSAVSDEAIEQVHQLSDALNHVGALVNNLKHRLTDFQELGQAEQDVLNAESALSQTKLVELESTIPVLIQRITGQQAAFAQSVQTVLAKVQFPLIVAEGSARPIAFFQELVAWAGLAAADVKLESVATAKIEALKASYTMASERQTHTAALQPMVAAVAGVTAVEASIDLFDDFTSPAPAVTTSPPVIVPGDLSLAETVSADIQASKAAGAGEELGDNVDLF